MKPIEYGFLPLRDSMGKLSGKYKQTIALSALLFSLSVPSIYAQEEVTILGRLIIPAIELDTTIVTIPLDASGTWDMGYAPHNVGWLDRTQWLEGNTPLAGHTPGVFDRLDTLREGDLISIRTNDQTVTYEVYRTFLTNVEDLTSIYPNQHFNEDKLTLITCTEASNTRRIVQAVRIT